MDINNIIGYQSPVSLMIKNVTDQVNKRLDNDREEYIMKCIMETGVEVNKEELIKALQYDRAQYDKGYQDGMKMVDFICSWLSDNFDPPCQYTRDDSMDTYMEFMNEDGFCADDCQKDNSYCWKRFFEKMMHRKMET